MKMYKWSVTFGDRTILVIAPDRFGATKEASKKMKVIWSKVARDMIVQKGPKVKENDLHL